MPTFFLLFTFFSSFHFFTATTAAHEFQVGGDNGWLVPKSRDDSQTYNYWASKNRFKVDDTVHFRYKKDSVMLVTAEEYEKCRSTRPLFFSNNGDTAFKLERAGLFYFISGVAGHCEKGQKMIIKVLEPETHPPSQNQSAEDDPEKKNNSGVSVNGFSFPLLLMVSFLGFLFI